MLIRLRTSIFNLLAFILFLHVKYLMTCGSKLVEHLFHAGLIHPHPSFSVWEDLGVKLAVKGADIKIDRGPPQLLVLDRVHLHYK